MAKKLKTTVGLGGVGVSQSNAGPADINTNVRAGVGLTGPTAGVSASRGDVGVSVGAGLTGVTPSVQIGRGAAARTGGQLGNLAGSPFGAPGTVIGSTVGSTIGSVVDSVTGSRYRKEHTARQGVLDSYGELGLFGADGQLVNPDGSVFNLSDSGGSNKHSWKDQTRRVKDGGGDELFQFETDYTNDMDYFASMGGITLSRILAGNTNKAVDQAGSALGNATLGSVGYGADFTQQNFNTVAKNQRAAFAKAGIQSKDDFLALANKAFSEGRIKDTDYVAAQQVAKTVFDEDFSTATALMAGRWKGLDTAAKTPSGSHQDERHNSHHMAPYITAEEATLAATPIGGWPQVKDQSSRSVWPAAIAGVMGGIGVYNRYQQRASKQPNQDGQSLFGQALSGAIRLGENIFGGGSDTPEMSFPDMDTADTGFYETPIDGWDGDAPITTDTSSDTSWLDGLF